MSKLDKYINGIEFKDMIVAIQTKLEKKLYEDAPAKKENSDQDRTDFFYLKTLKEK